MVHGYANIYVFCVNIAYKFTVVLKQCKFYRKY